MGKVLTHFMFAVKHLQFCKHFFMKKRFSLLALITCIEIFCLFTDKVLRVCI